MRNIISKIFRQKEGGFFLVEVLIALIIASTIAIGASAMVIQLMSVNSTNANSATVTSSVDSATHYLTRDVQMSEINVTKDADGNNIITGIGETGTEWLWLEWTWTDGEHRVAYQIEDGNLFRSHEIDGSPQGRTLVAEYIDAGQTDWNLIIEEPSDEETGEGELSVEITISASTGGYKSASETRTIQVVPRITA